ncbi:MAG TPA: prolyl oligopeptidase family serine peptidase, partial [Candidatus Binatia bacterium]|nr:prolyl oligopeptidase family serine peptidase [Candidatus Binatia bacterium]
MAHPTTAPYGSWKSPVTAELVGAGEVGLEQVQLDGPDVYWIERRPQEGGRKVIVRRSADGQVADVTPAPFNARTRVHEYGGGDYAVSDGTVVFSNFADQRLYIQRQGSAPRPLTPAVELRYADGEIDRRRNLFFCVREDHTASREPINTIVSIDLAEGDVETMLVSGNDFYSSPRLSPDGSRLAWLTWNHPNMPWDGTELWVGKLDADGSAGAAVQVGGSLDESICQPEWSPDGTLYFISDRTGWWNLYRWRAGKIEPVCPMDAEFGEPQWVFGKSLYVFESQRTIICSYTKDGKSDFSRMDTDTGTLDPVEIRYSAISQVRTMGSRTVLIAASPSEPQSIVSLDLATRHLEVLRRSRELTVDSGYLSAPRAIEFPTEHALTAHAIYYPPENRDYVGPADEKPPLLVTSHGGPTSATSTSLRYAIQYWTSRGIAVLDVNYGGSSGYGREYRERLKDQWGIVDVDDCINGARYLVERGEVDGNRLAIRGGSAGGYTTLSAL